MFSPPSDPQPARLSDRFMRDELFLASRRSAILNNRHSPNYFTNIQSLLALAAQQRNLGMVKVRILVISRHFMPIASFATPIF
jgi:hypothetical protein